MLGSRSGRSEAEDLLNVLTNGHGAQDVEEDEGAVGHVFARQIAVRNALEPGNGLKGQFGDDAAVEDRVEHGEKGGEGEPDDQHRLHFDERQIPVVRL